MKTVATLDCRDITRCRRQPVAKLGKPKSTEAQREANIKNGGRDAGTLTEAKMLGVGVAAMAGGYYLQPEEPEVDGMATERPERMSI